MLRAIAQVNGMAAMGKSRREAGASFFSPLHRALTAVLGRNTRARHVNL